jgi:hypothetical protein
VMDAADNSRMRSKEEIRGIVGGFAKSGMTRREYCAKHNIGIATLDYWRRVGKSSHPKLVEVAIEAQPQPSMIFRAGTTDNARPRVTSILANPRRFPTLW